MITGSRDFRHGNILDIFNGGFAAEGFKAKLFDVPGMPHDTADAQTLSAAPRFHRAGAVIQLSVRAYFVGKSLI